MASAGRILAVAILSCAIFPLLASAFLPRIGDFGGLLAPKHKPHNPPVHVQERKEVPHVVENGSKYLDLLKKIFRKAIKPKLDGDRLKNERIKGSDKKKKEKEKKIKKEKDELLLPKPVKPIQGLLKPIQELLKPIALLPQPRRQPEPAKPIGGFDDPIERQPQPQPEPAKPIGGFDDPIERQPQPEPAKPIGGFDDPIERQPQPEPTNPIEGIVEPIVNEPQPQLPKPVQGGLKVGFYQQTCPQAENIVKEAMNRILERDVKLAPSIIRLFFHDCFVTGCDASILLDTTPTNEEVEKQAPTNGIFVKGYAEIEEIKAQLEAACPGIVSCADTLAFANREALIQVGVPSYDVASGRRDRPVSLAKNVDANIPLPETPVPEIIQLFARKGLSLEELVLLVGAHSVGEAHCTVVSGRFANEEKRKEINPQYLDKLHVHLICADPEEQTLPFDRMSHHQMDSAFYNQLLARETLLESDHNLAKEPNANAVMRKYANNQQGWLKKFTEAMVKMGEIEVLTGDQGEIRRQCKAFN